jgi:hypothetical protein
VRLSLLSDISDSHGDEYEDSHDGFLGHSTV